MLCRSGVAIPLTDDHKAAREDETVCLTTQKLGQQIAVLGLQSYKLQQTCKQPFGVRCPLVNHADSSRS